MGILFYDTSMGGIQMNPEAHPAETLRNGDIHYFQASAVPVVQGKGVTKPGERETTGFLLHLAWHT